MRNLKPITLMLLACVNTVSLAAEGYPNRPIRVVVPFPAGGTPDANARAVFEPVGKSLGQNIIIDNRAGANGMVGADIVRRAVADGHTLLFTTVSFVINPAVQKKTGL